MNPEKLTTVLQQADFDVHGKSQQRVLSTLSAPRSFYRRRWIITMATCLLLCLWLGWKSPLNNKLFSSKKPSSQQCANLNARYLLEKMAEEEQLVSAKCPLSVTNKQILEEIKQQMRQNYRKLTEKERKQLEYCDESFKSSVETSISYIVRC